MPSGDPMFIHPEFAALQRKFCDNLTATLKAETHRNFEALAEARARALARTFDLAELQQIFSFSKTAISQHFASRMLHGAHRDEDVHQAEMRLFGGGFERAAKLVESYQIERAALIAWHPEWVG